MTCVAFTTLDSSIDCELLPMFPSPSLLHVIFGRGMPDAKQTREIGLGITTCELAGYSTITADTVWNRHKQVSTEFYICTNQYVLEGELDLPLLVSMHV